MIFSDLISTSIVGRIGLDSSNGYSIKLRSMSSGAGLAELGLIEKHILTRDQWTGDSVHDL